MTHFAHNTFCVSAMWTPQRNFFYLAIVSYLSASSAAADGQIRLAGPRSTRCSGRVEIYHNNRWGTVCGYGWDFNDAEVVCRELNCGRALRIPSFGPGTGQIWLADVSCSGSESSLTECRHRGFGISYCGHHQDAGVICSDVRLAGSGSTWCSGRVEIYHHSRWGTVCDDGWDFNDAEVVCRELKCGRALSAPQSAHFGEGIGQIWLDDVSCSGNERSITQCGHKGFGKHNCTHHKDAGVICSGVPIRLAGSGSTQCSGTVEVYHNNSWGTICDHDWDFNDAEVVCRQLDCGTVLDAPTKAVFGPGIGQIWLDEVSCSGSESSLTECQHRGFGSHDCGHDENAGVICSGLPVRLSGTTLCSGRVEIFYNNTWGTVCDDLWDLNDAEVVCRELGCGKAENASVSAHFGQGSGPIWLDDVECSGSERSLTQCKHRGYGTHNCTHSKDAGVICSVILPKPSIFMTPVVVQGRDLTITCSVTTPTKQLLDGEFILSQTSGSFNQTQTSRTNFATFKILSVGFDKQGSYQCQFSQGSSFSQSDSVNLSVVETPRISLTSPNGGLSRVPEGPEIIEGYSFIFTCTYSIHHQGGVFSLIYLPSVIIKTEPSVNNSASFSFPAAQFEHEGSYSCVYEITLPSGKFTSPEADQIHVNIIYPRTAVLRFVFLPLILLLENIALHFYYKGTIRQKSAKKGED